MKVNFWIKNAGAKYDLSQTEQGNPGIGGTQYELSLVSYLLNKMCDDISVVVYTDNIGLSSKDVQISYVDNYSKMLHAINHTGEILVFAQTYVDQEFYQELSETSIYAVVWVHNYLTYLEYKNINVTRNVKKIVFVGQQLYDHYIDTPLIKKSTVIYNCIPKYDEIKNNKDFDNPSIIFNGALIRQKGFHVLAKAWNRILSECPNAQLYVMGGNLYGNKAEVHDYIEKCCKYLRDKNGELLESVHFLGALGNEKEKYYENAVVGVSNPTGQTETFCLSAVEFEAHKIPVVTYNGYGLLDTVLDGKTGIRIKTASQLSEAIVQLIKNKKLNEKMGTAGRKFVNSTFTPEIIIPKWHWLLTEGIQYELKSEFSFKNLADNYKWLYYFNSRLQKSFGIMQKISIHGISIWFKFKLKQILFRRK